MGRRGKGEGSIFKRKDGRWCGFITVGYDEKGNQKKKFFYGKTRQEVAEKINQALNEIILHLKIGLTSGCISTKKIKLVNQLLMIMKA